MNYSFIHLLNQYKNCVLQKHKIMRIKYSKQNIAFSKFLLKKSFISFILIKLLNKNQIIHLYLKYDISKNSAISSFSLNSKPSCSSIFLKKKYNKKQQNFSVGFNYSSKNTIGLLACFR